MENPAEVQVQVGALREQFGNSYRGRTDRRNSDATFKTIYVLPRIRMFEQTIRQIVQTVLRNDQDENDLHDAQFHVQEHPIGRTCEWIHP